jgi:predicted  nucleic acid-binding Zn-ribbon protein
MSIDDEFCQNCGTSRKGTTKPESTASATGSMLRRLGRLRSPKALLLIALIVGASLLGASFAFQPHSTTPEYLASLRDQLSQLNGQLSGLHQEADTLRSQVSALQGEISASQNKASALHGEIQQLQNQLNSLRSEILSLRQQLDDVGNQLTSARTSLNVAQQELNEIRSSLQEATAKVQQLESQLHQEKGALQSYIAYRDQAQRTHDSLLDEYNSRAGKYNDRMNTYNQKMNEYNTRWGNLKSKILGAAVIGVIAVAIASFLTGGLALSDIPTVLSILSTFGIDVQGMSTEYEALQQLKVWLQNEEDWLRSESKQLETLKSRLEKATSDLAHWNDMVQTQQALVDKTQNDLDYWTSQKNQLTSQLSEAQNRVNQLTTQVKDMESKQAQLQSSLDSDLAKEQQVESSAISKEVEVNRLQDLIQSRSKEKSTAETTLRKCEADMQNAKSQADALNYEINLVIVHPYLRWGGLAIFAIAIVALIVTAVGVATLMSGVRAGIGKMRRLRRVGPVQEITIPTETIEPAEEVPVQQAGVTAEAVEEAHAKPELTLIPSTPAAPKIVKRRKRRPAAAKPMRR